MHFASSFSTLFEKPPAKLIIGEFLIIKGYFRIKRPFISPSIFRLQFSVWCLNMLINANNFISNQGYQKVLINVSYKDQIKLF